MAGRPIVLGGTEKLMFRVQIIVAAAIAIGPALAGCSGSSPSMPSLPSPPPPQTLQFESKPPGADVQTAQGQTCRTPCSLALPVASQSVTFALIGYVSETMRVEVGQSGGLGPNPVEVTLQAVPPPIKPIRKPRKKPVPKTADQPPATQPPAATAPTTPSPAAPFPPPPATSPFPPPPQLR